MNVNKKGLKNELNRVFLNLCVFTPNLKKKNLYSFKEKAKIVVTYNLNSINFSGSQDLYEKISKDVSEIFCEEYVYKNSELVFKSIKVKEIFYNPNLSHLGYIVDINYYSKVNLFTFLKRKLIG